MKTTSIVAIFREDKVTIEFGPDEKNPLTLVFNREQAISLAESILSKFTPGRIR